MTATILFLAVLFVLILVHEFGHFIAARRSGMKVEEFAIGFPPRLFSITKGETEYSLNLLPIGGYVKILGENGAEEIAPHDRARSFGARPRLQQAIVLVAGVAMNILAAWLIFFAVGMIGTPAIVEEASPNAVLTVIEVLPGSPAEEAGVPLGAAITSLRSGEDTLQYPTPATLSDFIADHPHSPTDVAYTHHGNAASATVMPKAGVIEAEPDRPAIGLSSALVETVRQNPLAAFVSASERTVTTLYAIVAGTASLIASAFTLSADLSQVTGPIGIAGLVGDAAEFGLVSLLIFAAFISLNLAVINLLPVPALDGGRLLFVAIEAVIRRPLDPEWSARANLIGFVFLIALMVAVTYNDIVRII